MHRRIARALIFIVPSLAIAATLFALSRRAASDQAPRFPVEQPVPLPARVALLEQRVHGMEQRLKAFEKLQVRAQPDGTYVLSANGARVQIARDGSVVVTPAPSAGTTARGALPAADPCDPPYEVGATGIRTIKPECLQIAPCDPPYTVDLQGRRQPKK